MTTSLLAPPVRLVREALYITVGAGVLAVQKAQVQRRELEQKVSRRFAGSTAPDPG